jgi:hypothetical protein
MDGVLESLQNQQEEANPDTSEDELIVVHLMKEEAVALDSAQGGETLDPSTGVREYSQLWKLMETKPGFKEIFEQTAADLGDNGQLDDPELSQLYEIGKQELPKYIKDPGDRNPEIEAEQRLGRNGDTELAMFPVGLADFFDDLRGDRSLNPKTGLREYWGFKSIINSVIRVGGTIAGAALGGPFGAVAGNALGRMATGQKMGSAAMSALPNALYAGMGQLGAQALTNFAPNLASGITGASQAGLGSGATSFLGNALNNGQGLSMFGPSVGSVAAGSGAATGAAAAGTTAAAATPAAPGYMDLIKNAYNAPGMSSIGNVLGHPTTMMMGAAALKYKGHLDEKKAMEKERRATEESNRQQAHAVANWDPGSNATSGEEKIRFVPRLVKQYDARGHQHTSVERVPVDEYGQPTDGLGVHARIITDNLAPNYSHGGSVHHGGYHGIAPSANSSMPGFIAGKGKGQADLVPKNVPAKSYILDATSVANLGDGSSRAGKEEIDEALIHLRKKPIASSKSAPRKVRGREDSRHQIIPAMLSDGEYELTPEDVTRIGMGSNAKGAKMLKHVVKTLRTHKNSNGDRLPPKSKDLLYYLKEAANA